MNLQSPPGKRHNTWLVLPPIAVLVLAWLGSFVMTGPLSGPSGGRAELSLSAFDFILLIVLAASGMSVAILRRKHMI